LKGFLCGSQEVMQFAWLLLFKAIGKGGKTSKNHSKVQKHGTNAEQEKAFSIISWYRSTSIRKDGKSPIYLVVH
jgi:hypothetical protein